MKKQKGFTLIELLIVVAIIGIIAAIAIPNLLAAIQRAKQKRGMAEVRSIATSAQSYAVDTNIYPGQPPRRRDRWAVSVDSVPGLYQSHSESRSVERAVSVHGHDQ